VRYQTGFSWRVSAANIWERIASHGDHLNPVISVRASYLLTLVLIAGHLARTTSFKGTTSI
jgi:hypothetical protein